jgi:hypothetical protein
MKFNKLRLIFLLKFFTVAIFVLISLKFIISRESRKHLFFYFNTHCLDYRQKDFSRKLNDRIVDYSAEAKLRGIRVCKDRKDLKLRISDRKLVRVRSGNKYIVEEMTYSHPYVTKATRILLDEIGKRFREKTEQKGFGRARFYVTSMTRITENIKNLRQNNSNASANSPHLYGNALDISYKRFSVRKMVLTNCDDKYLKEALAEVIWQLRSEKKCWATYERGQNCYHIVSR